MADQNPTRFNEMPFTGSIEELIAVVREHLGIESQPRLSMEFDEDRGWLACVTHVNPYDWDQQKRLVVSRRIGAEVVSATSGTSDHQKPSMAAALARLEMCCERLVSAARGARA